MVEFVKLRKNKKDEDEKRKPLFSIKTILLFFLFFFIISSFISGIMYSITPKIALVKINGVISTEVENSLYGRTISSRETASTIRNLKDDESVKAIILDINSGGGSPVASEEISLAIESVKKVKPVYALINDIGASGAFWIAVSANKTYASSMSTLGSIGVTSVTLGFEDLIREYNITYRKQTAGEYKDLGSPFRKPLPQEEEIIQDLLDEIHLSFIEHVAKSRDMEIDEVKKYSNGEIFLGKKAKEIGFIDEIGYYPDVVKELKNITKASDSIIVEYGPQPSLAEVLGINTLFTFPKMNSEVKFR